MTMHTVLMMDGKKQQIVESLLEHIVRCQIMCEIAVL